MTEDNSQDTANAQPRVKRLSKLTDNKSLDNAKVEYIQKEPMIARIVSLLLHPLLMASYGISLLFLYTDFAYIYADQYMLFLAPVVVLTCAVPLSCLYVLVRMDVISGYKLEDKDERAIPFVIALLAYGLLFYYFYQVKSLPMWFLSMLAAPIALLIISAIINVFWKISAHMLSIGCLIGSVLSICYNIKGINPYPLFIILFILAGALGVSRIILKRHTPAQVYVGFLVGLIISYLCIWIGGNFAYLYLLWKF